MESDDKIHSPNSPAATDSPDSPETNGRITVTVAAPAPVPSPTQNNLALALPVQQPPAKSNGGGGGREDCWSEGATAVLIEAWGERYLELSRGNLKQKHWKEVADIVSSREDYRKTPKTDIQCKNRIDTVKKKYKLEKSKISAGGGPSKWPFYDRLDRLIGPTAKISGSPGAGGGDGNAAAANNSVVSSSRKVHLGIPVGIRGGASRDPYPRRPSQIRTKTPGQKVQLRKRRRPADSDSTSQSEGESSPASPVSSDSLPPGTAAYEVAKRPRMARVVMNNSDSVAVETKGKGWGSAIRELTQAILKFGEAYEKAESSKIMQVVEMEKQRMKFTKEMELQRMQFFMKTQVELSQLKRGKKGGGGGGNGSNVNNNNNINNHCDSDNLVRLD